MRLAQYLKKTGESEASFARRVEAPRSAVHKWLEGTLPSRLYMQAVYRETDAQVTPNDFYGLRRPARREAQAGWDALNAQFDALEAAKARGEIGEDEYRLQVFELEIKMREELEDG